MTLRNKSFAFQSEATNEVARGGRKTTESKTTNMFEIKVNGKAVRQFQKDGNFYVEGREGTEYSILVKNNTFRRRLFVISVDGINVISGKPAKDDDQNGYVLDGYRSLDLKGFRLDNDAVAAFKFVKSDKSYAKDRTGSAANNGVIGVRVYDEKQKIVPRPDPFLLHSPLRGRLLGGDDYIPKSVNWTAGAKPCADWVSHEVERSMSMSDVVLSSAVQQPKAEFNLGTGWGSKKNQAVTEVEFEVGNLALTEILYYASRPQLEAMGVKIDDSPTIRVMPSAFGESKFCPAPSGWKG